MTADDMALLLMRTRFNRSTVMPRFTPPSWFECDVAEITKAGFFVEYEIKTTITDFHADAKKRLPAVRWTFAEGWLEKPIEQPTKHERLASRDEQGPARFFFVSQSGVIPESVIPEWSGLIWIAGNRWPTIKVSAPQLHRAKRLDIPPIMHRASYFRWHISKAYKNQK